jgi:hypothetical protein
MTNSATGVPVRLTEADIESANTYIVNFLQRTMVDGRKELARLQKKLAITYWVIIALSVVMFAIGIWLLSVPVRTAVQGNADLFKSLIAGGFGIADLAALFLFRPVERIHRLMGDMSQVFLALNCFQTEFSLRLLEMNLKDRPTIGKASEYISLAAEKSIKWVEEYFEKIKVWE